MNDPFQLADQQEMVCLLEQLIRIPGHEDCADQEKAIGQFICLYLQEAGIEAQLQEVVNGRSNVIARVRGTGGGKSLMLNGHIDTIPPYDMKDALNPTCRDGLLYGRGAVDMLGAVSAMITTLIRVHRSRIKLGGDLVFTGVIGEESGSVGAWALTRGGIRTDYAIVGEPTRMNLAVAHKGVEWLEVHFRGRAAHGSSPEKGINAIYHAHRFIQLIREEHIAELAARRHPLLGHSTMNIGEIHGGKRPTIVPDYCVVRLERRYVPGETREQVWQEVQTLLDQVRLLEDGVDVSVNRMPVTAEVPHDAFEVPPDSPLVRTLSSAYQAAAGQPNEIMGVHFWSDAAILANYGHMETVICGPGDIAQAHSNEEYIELSQMYLAAEMYWAAALKLCAASR